MSKIQLCNQPLYFEKCSAGVSDENTMNAWIKFTSHLKEDEKFFIEFLNIKDSRTITYEERKRFKELQEHIQMVDLLNKYKNRECSLDEYNKVVKFMGIGLDNLIVSRMTDEEMIASSRFVSSLETENDLIDFISTENDCYNDLSVFDAYKLYLATLKLKSIKSKDNREFASEIWSDKDYLKRYVRKYPADII